VLPSNRVYFSDSKNVQDQRVNSKLFDSIATITVSFMLGYGFQLFYNYMRSIQLTSLLLLVFCRCFEKNCTLHCNVIYFQTIYILSSNFMSVIFSQPSVHTNQPVQPPDLCTQLHVESLQHADIPSTLYSKTKRCRKTKIGPNVPQDKTDRCACFQSKRSGGRPHNMSARG